VKYSPHSLREVWNIFCRLFIDSQKLSDEVRAHLKSEELQITILPYSDVATHLAKLVCQGAGGTEKIWVSFCIFAIFSICHL